MCYSLQTDASEEHFKNWYLIRHIGIEVLVNWDSFVYNTQPIQCLWNTDKEARIVYCVSVIAMVYDCLLYTSRCV